MATHIERNISNGSDILKKEIRDAFKIGQPALVETVDFGDPERPPTCVEVDFPIVPINEIAAIEGKGSGALKPVYQVMKWWARRRSTVFRQLLISAITKAPENRAQAAALAWSLYYRDFRRNRNIADLKVADIFMGGGTTVVEALRLGLRVYGTDLNPIAWLTVKNSIAKVSEPELQKLLGEIERRVRPEIIPFYACHCPRGHKGHWTDTVSGKAMQKDFDPLAVPPTERSKYTYKGPEIVYVFWVKHGVCQRTECRHVTPIATSMVIAQRTLSVRSWPGFKCTKCETTFDVEESDTRLAPGVPLVLGEGERPFVVLGADTRVTCPVCRHVDAYPALEGKSNPKSVELSVLVHPEWLRGVAPQADHGAAAGGTTESQLEATLAWNTLRSAQIKLLEVRGRLPEVIESPELGLSFSPESGTVPKRSTFTCANCGTQQDVLEATKKTGTNAPVAAFAIHGFCPDCAAAGHGYGGRFFAAMDDASQINAASKEWEKRKGEDLAEYWPTSEIPYGFMTAVMNGGIRSGQGFSHWWKMFNPRQLLVHAHLLRAILSEARDTVGWPTREVVLGAFQQYLRNQNMFSFWNMQRALEPLFSTNNFHPKATTIENSVFNEFARGSWYSCVSAITESLTWAKEPWEIVSTSQIGSLLPQSKDCLRGSSEKMVVGDSPCGTPTIECASATQLDGLPTGTYDLVITDPPFGGLLHYSELADFFYVWLRLALKERYPALFQNEYCPKALEVVSNTARHPEDADGFYQRLLTGCWREAQRILKPGGILAFTFHHSEDEPWVAVLESLFDAGFYLEITYPIRSDESKGEGEFGSRKIEYDIIHVCRKRTDQPRPVSWARMRREVLLEARQFAEIIELHQKQGLPEGDLKVIKRGKALEYYSRHYGNVYVDEGKQFSVRDALIGINQLLDEESGNQKEHPPVNAEPMTRQFLRLFDGRAQLPRDQMQKLLRGTTIDPKEYEERGWCIETQKVYHLVSPLDIAKDWYGKHRRRLTTDYEQAAVLIGASFPQSGINVMDTLSNANFRPHPALGRLLKWHVQHGATPQVRNAATIASQIYGTWEVQHRDETHQMKLFFDDGEES